MKKILALLFLLGSSASVSAQSYVVDFENFNTFGALFEDVDDLLVITNVQGSGVDVTIDGGTDNRVYDLVQFGGYQFSGPQALIDWDWAGLQNSAGTDILFSTPVNSVSLIAGDFGGDDDSPLTLTAYDAGGGVVGSVTIPWNGSPPFALLSVSGNGIVRVHYASGGSFTNSTFIDDITFEVTGPTLTSTGTPGGPMTFDVAGATPGGPVVYFYAFGLGSFAGTNPYTGNLVTTGLSSSNFTVISVVTADGAGAATLSHPNVPVAAIGLAHVQAIDGLTDSFTNTLSL